MFAVRPIGERFVLWLSSKRGAAIGTRANGWRLTCCRQRVPLALLKTATLRLSCIAAMLMAGISVRWLPLLRGRVGLELRYANYLYAEFRLWLTLRSETRGLAAGCRE